MDYLNLIFNQPTEVNEGLEHLFQITQLFLQRYSKDAKHVASGAVPTRRIKTSMTIYVFLPELKTFHI